jgi:cytochrome c oxidase cbb3-type subunit 2
MIRVDRSSDPSCRARRAGLAGLALLALAVPLALGQTDEATEVAISQPAPSPSDPQPLEYEKWKTVTPGQHPAYNQRANLAQRGHEVYRIYCVGCHGETGDGNGPAAKRLITKPRDFTSGIYKFRSTDSGSLPMEADLLRTITRGMARVSMPAFPLMSERDKLAVIEYIKGFYPRWDAEKHARGLVMVPRAPDDLQDEERVMRGRVVYLEMQCSSCHGLDGAGSGATRTEYIDAWGNEQKPFNFTRGSLKGGDDPEDIYRVFHTGLRSVMPAYGGETLALVTRTSFAAREEQIGAQEFQSLQRVIDQFPETADEIFALPESERLTLIGRNSWDLVAYIQSLRSRTTTTEAVLGALDR